MAKTVKEHTQEIDRVSAIIKDANALVLKLQAELAIARGTFEDLRAYQHPLHEMQIPYPFRKNNGPEKQKPANVIDTQISRINDLLGDKA